jgi:hypothetical protein
MSCVFVLLMAIDVVVVVYQTCPLGVPLPLCLYYIQGGEVIKKVTECWDQIAEGYSILNTERNTRAGYYTLENMSTKVSTT